MRRVVFSVSLLAVAASAMAVPAPFGAGYRESWNSYAVGIEDATYSSVWTPYRINDGTNGNASYVPITRADWDIPVIGTTSSVSTPNCIQYATKNFALVNSLVDGVTNGQAESAELASDQKLVPDGSALLNTGNGLDNYDNLQLRITMSFGSLSANKKYTAGYTELSSGAIHAPALTGALEPLATAIPLIAVGKLTTNYTNAANTATGQNVSPYFFDGKQWLKMSNYQVSQSTNHLAAKIFYDGASTYGWSAYVQFLNNTGTVVPGASYTFPLQFDPTVGFDTVSYIMPNGVSSAVDAGGTLPGFDDAWVAGGLVVPEPATLILLGLGAVVMRRRK